MNIIKHFTNGSKSIYVQKTDFGYYYYNDYSDIPENIRYFAPIAPVWIEPLAAQMWHVSDILYPELKGRCMSRPTPVSITSVKLGDCVGGGCLYADDKPCDRCEYWNRDI